MGADLWYKDGLRFECLRCGSCCSGFSGTVRVSDEEIVALAQRLDLPEAEFRKDYTRMEKTEGDVFENFRFTNVGGQ